MKRTILFVAAAVGAALVTAACGGTGSYGSYGTSNPAGGTPAASGAATVSVANSSRGQILVDGSGRTLYLFEADKAASSSCYGACVGVWPAVVTTGQPAAGPGAKASLLGTTKRSDGTLEVVYNGHPLYYFSGDKMAGDVTGQGLSSFGAAWYAVSPGGTKIDTTSSRSVGGY
jgi:predicted lipoprotein with Yx(FWY)xxD motif